MKHGKEAEDLGKMRFVTILLIVVFAVACPLTALAGTMTYWDEASRNMVLVSNGLWAGVFDLTGWTNIEFKFVANDQWTSANWGDDNPTNTIVPLRDIADSFGANIMATGAFASIPTEADDGGSISSMSRAC